MAGVSGCVAGFVCGGRQASVGPCGARVLYAGDLGQMVAHLGALIGSQTSGAYPMAGSYAQGVAQGIDGCRRRATHDERAAVVQGVEPFWGAVLGSTGEGADEATRERLGPGLKRRGLVDRDGRLRSRGGLARRTCRQAQTACHTLSAEAPRGRRPIRGRCPEGESTTATTTTRPALRSSASHTPR